VSEIDTLKEIIEASEKGKKGENISSC